MKIGRKIFLYSMGVSIITLLAVTLLFTLLFPDLYIQQLEEQKLKELHTINSYFQEHNSLINDSSYYSVNTITVALKPTQALITLEALYGHSVVKITDESLVTLLAEVDFTNYEQLAELAEQLVEYLETTGTNTFEIAESQGYIENFGASEIFEVIRYKGIDIYKAGTSIQGGKYLNYVALYQSEDTIYLTYSPLMQSSFQGVLWIVIKIIASILGLLLVALLTVNGYFSRRFSKPIRSLTRQAQEKEHLYGGTAGGNTHTTNEIKLLQKNFESLIATLEGYIQEIQQEKEHQEFFMQASSHQLKTPIASSLLMLSGMIDKVGKYQDTDTYLPQLRGELLRLKEIVDKILSLSSELSNGAKLALEEVELKALFQDIIQEQALLAEEKHIAIHNQIASHATIHTNGQLLKQIIENLLHNAITYSPKESTITIAYQQTTQTPQGSLTIHNSNAHISESLLPTLLQPFTRGDTQEDGTGLGLYIAAYFCKSLGYTLKIENITRGAHGTHTTHNSNSAHGTHATRSAHGTQNTLSTHDAHGVLATIDFQHSKEAIS